MFSFENCYINVSSITFVEFLCDNREICIYFDDCNFRIFKFDTDETYTLKSSYLELMLEKFSK